MALISNTSFDIYKRRMIPVLYDWFMHYHLSYPTQTCRWGPKVEDLGYKTKYRAYLSEQVVDGLKPDTLILAHIDVLKPHVASCEAVSNWQEKSQAPYVHTIKTIYHPGEVNKVRELPQHPEIVVTHTDSPQLYVWNMDRQPDRRPPPAGLATIKTRSSRDRGAGGDKSGSEPDSQPDLVLVGHEDDAQFPLACSAGAPRVGSGGNDNLVLVWDLADQITALASTSAASAKQSELKPRCRLEGHTATVGDLVFQPRGKDVLISVADDGRVITWDLRGVGGKGGSYVASKLQDAHGPGINIMCVDWNPVDENLLVTGAQDGILQVWDRRRMSSRNDRLFTFDVHRNPASQSQSDIIHVEWHPTCKDVFASGSEDHTIAIWDLSPSRLEAADAAAAAADKDGAAAAAEAGQQSSNGAVDGGNGGGGGGGGAGEKDKEKSAPARKRARNSGVKDGAGGKAGAAAGTDEIPPQLIFRHLGHKSGRVTDFQWNPAEPWTIISVSENRLTEDYNADGTLQVWRIMDLLYRPFDEAVAELEQHREFILRGGTPTATTTSSPTAKDKEKDAMKAPGVIEVKQDAAAS
ncbi:hypothetical protein Vretimale_13300 [Volvox reticuliferus]|uniref:Histone-binding protein RBBP4-like N-terminal domain-containing protein n=1 Tax=Volvox reticuliferus TaxID=1737510 RepID=A0A8J4FQ55_9CHLO|nr:hypothetical protein Vretifemale_14088 [Volvox reticuliferus]GIM09446.1 hypothetical protein Vretimale_13300 [Volvox reticuliferus]